MTQNPIQLFEILYLWNMIAKNKKKATKKISSSAKRDMVHIRYIRMVCGIHMNFQQI